jgi:hypothetical protein
VHLTMRQEDRQYICVKCDQRHHLCVDHYQLRLHPVPLAIVLRVMQETASKR